MLPGSGTANGREADLNEAARAADAARACKWAGVS
jgi:hypothetical protein